MSEMMKRRTFLKTAGAVMAAVALAACDGDTPAPAPTTKPSSSGSSDIPLGDITLKSTVIFSTKKVRLGSTKEIPAWGISWNIVPNKDITFGKDNFSMEANGEKLEYLGIWNRDATVKNDGEYTVTETLDVEAAKGQTQVTVYFKVTEEQYQEGGTFNTTIESDGKKFVFNNCKAPAGKFIKQ